MKLTKPLFSVHLISAVSCLLTATSFAQTLPKVNTVKNAAGDITVEYTAPLGYCS